MSIDLTQLCKSDWIIYKRFEIIRIARIIKKVQHTHTFFYVIVGIDNNVEKCHGSRILATSTTMYPLLQYLLKI